MAAKQKVTVVGNLLLAYTENPREKWQTRIPAGHGWFNPGGIYYTRYANKKLKSLVTWENMQIRCTRFGKTLREDRARSYLERDAVDEFKNYQTYCEWFREQVENGSYQEGFELNHNLLIPGNKIYSPDTCLFIPMEVNRIAVAPNRSKCGFNGVEERDGKFYSAIVVKGKKECFGEFNTAEEASQMWVKKKIEHIQSLAIKWKPVVSEKVFNAIWNWVPNDRCN